MFLILFLSISQAIQVLEGENQPVSDTIPLSVSIDQMDALYDENSCNVEIECTDQDNCDPKCGKQCTATQSGHYFQYKFVGVQFQVFGTKGAGQGPINIKYDGNDLSVDISSGSTENHALLYTSLVLDYGEHTIRVEGNGKSFTIHKFTFWPSSKAKRLNYTDLGPSGNWIRQSDGIGGYRAWANTDASLTQTITCSRLWAYGSKAPNHGIIKITFDNYYREVNLSSTKRDDLYLLMASDIFKFAPHRFSVLNPYVSEITFYCIYYDHEVLPSQTPAPDPSTPPVPYEQADLEGKTYEGKLPKGFITLTPEDCPSITKIKNMKFTNVVSDGNHLAKLGKNVEFSGNVFEYSEGVVSPTIFFCSLQKETLTIDHCTFSGFRTLKQQGEGLLMTFNKEMYVNFETCTFKNNGQSEGDYMIKLNGEQSLMKFLSCTFEYDKPNSGSKVGYFIGGGITFDGCTFTNSPRDMIRLNPDWLTQPGFVFTNNIVQGNTKQFIMATQHTQGNPQPIIKNNIFQDINMESGYLISFIHSLSEIELINNTFQRITTRAGSYCGGMSSWYQNSFNNQMTLKYTDCKFYDITNNNDRSPYNQGGALHYGYTTSISNCAVTLNGCEFKRNNCENGQGGAIAFNTDRDLTISNCVFENNQAFGNGGAIYFWSKIEKPSDNSQAPDFDGKMKIGKILITDCQFTGNKGYDGHAIYINSFYSLSDAKLEIKGCTFNNNGENNEQYMIYASIGELVFDGNNVEYTDKTKASGILKYSDYDGKSISFTDSTFVNCNYDNPYEIKQESIEISTNIDSDKLAISFSGCQFTDCKSNNYVVKTETGHTTVDSCTFTYESNDASHSCGAISFGKQGFTLRNSNFIRTCATGAIYLAQNAEDSVLIDGCVFEDCMGDNKRCMYIALTYNDFTFRNTVFRKMRETGNRGYICSIECVTPLPSITLDNISFLNNRCNCDYGGGSGIWITDCEVINFNNCHFIENKVLKSPNPRDKVPLEATEQAYYTGDGGGLQFGFSNTIYNANMVFNECEFIRNRAIRHGGALALQTVGNVEIISCTFEDNIANDEDDTKTSANLLFNNYYSKKTHGRGGAIYINPAFNHKDSQDGNKFMKSVKIDRCTLKQNSGYDGYAIYIQGDDPGTTFSITNNQFIDNNNDEFINNDSGIRAADKALIFSEITRIDLDSTNKVEYKVEESKRPVTINFGDPEDTEDDGPDYFDVVNITTSGRHEYGVKDNSVLIVTVVISTFNNIHSGSKDGGALYIFNAGLACQDITFNSCTSDARGGAIFLHNTYTTTNYANIIRSKFTKCTAKIGGGAFVFSSNQNYKATVKDCTFEGNQATATSSDNLFGGSGLFIAAKKGRVRANKFENNIGEGSSLHFDNNFDNPGLNTLDESKQGNKKFIISDCKFVLSPNSRSAFSYNRGKNGNLVILSDCSFEGDLESGSHYINGKSTSNNSPKLIVKNCKFADKSKAFILDSDFASFDLKNDSKFDRKDKVEKISKSALTVIVASATVTVLAVVGFAIFALKKNNNDFDDNDKMSSEL